MDDKTQLMRSLAIERSPHIGLSSRRPAGKVADLPVEEGMAVEAGQVLAKLDDALPEKDYALAQARAEASDVPTAAIAADLRDVERILDRAQTLSQKNFATEADLTKAQARARVLQSRDNFKSLHRSNVDVFSSFQC